MKGMKKLFTKKDKGGGGAVREDLQPAPVTIGNHSDEEDGEGMDEDGSRMARQRLSLDDTRLRKQEPGTGHAAGQDSDEEEDDGTGAGAAAAADENGNGAAAAEEAPIDPRDLKYKGPEGIICIGADLTLPIQIGSRGNAGWEPMRGPNRRKSVEVRKENQDAFCAHAPYAGDEYQMLFAVFDGHGQDGRKLSHNARDTLPVVLQQEYAKTGYGTIAVEEQPENKRTEINKARFACLAKAFESAEAASMPEELGINHQFSGTTGVVAWMLGADLYVAWVGDSRAIMGRKEQQVNGKDKYKTFDLTYDQIPTRADEKKRVRGAGGRIARWKRNFGPLRVWLPDDWIPGLAMTRSIGDTVLNPYGGAAVPEVSHLRMSEKDSFLIVASDGVWEFMPSQEVVDFVGRLRRQGVPPDEAADMLVGEAVKRWRRNEVVVDDTTVVVVYLDFDEGSDAKKKDLKSKFFKGKATGGEKPQQITDDGKMIPFNPKNTITQMGPGQG
ncbi:putative protein phosphatase 2C 65 [Porphyridium purpureum]|uniref:PPM-type phosphatase domain-containing protein n=1 Tax=Porphyridium purpureum TaxID=35688 RepID=A0A5J4Z9L7_PORPP|nr:putative protein phosphatase 2C 65 [Porphyridium purpureum]|eukprot:POR8794..scf295_1